jgi:ribose transport system permease protein
MNIRKRLSRAFANGLAVWIIVLVVIVIASLTSTTFLSSENIPNILGQVPFLAVGTIGMFIAVIAGQIDLSIAAVAKLTAVLVSGISDGDPVKFVFAVILSYAIGFGVGMFNSLLIVKLRIPAFIATLGTFSILEGLVLAYTVKGIGSVPIGVTNFFYDGKGPLPYSFMVLVLLIAIVWWWLRSSRLSMRMYAVGGDPEVARRSGVSSGPVITSAMVLCSMFAVTAGLIQVSRAGVGAPTTGEGLELAAITAVVLGGASLMGGKGKLFGVLGGAALLTLIDNALNMIGVSQYSQGLVRGGVIVAAIAIFVAKRRGAEA